jgi:hypothetical protein
MSSPWTLIGTEVHEPVGMPKAHFPHQCFLLSILTKQWKLLSFNPSPVFWACSGEHFSCGFFCFPVLFTWECWISKLHGNYWVVMYIVSCSSCSLYGILHFHLYVIVDCCLWKFVKHIQIFRLDYNMCLIARFRLKIEMQNI